MIWRITVRRAALLGLLLAGPVAACGSKVTSLQGSSGGSSGGGGGNGGSGGASSGSGDDNGGGGSGQSSGGVFMPSTSSGGTGTIMLAPDAACAFSSQMGQQQALNAYMMLDYSLSMKDNGKWTGVTAAINSFVQQPTSGISVGLQYFAQSAPPPDAGAAGGLFCLIPAVCDSCDPAAYAQPAIEIAPLPGIASQITASLAAHASPNTATPTGPALQGAIDHATTWAKAHPSDATIVILATDGDPSECGSANSTASLISQVETIAAAGVAATPKILTFVIGVGTETANLNGIAMAGGTNSAFIVDTSQNVSTQFLAALNKIRGAALGCQYKLPIPEAGTVDTAEVNVQFTAPGGKPELVPQVANQGQCPASGNAWYYDNPATPSEILLCTTTCGTVSTGGTVAVLTGCQTVMAPPTK